MRTIHDVIVKNGICGMITYNNHPYNGNLGKMAVNLDEWIDEHPPIFTSCSSFDHATYGKKGCNFSFKCLSITIVAKVIFQLMVILPWPLLLKGVDWDSLPNPRAPGFELYVYVYLHLFVYLDIIYSHILYDIICI